MAPHISRVEPAHRHQSGGIFSVNSINLNRLDGLASPLALLDNFRVSGAPFGPHPHAGFSAITYVLEDSSVALRSRDSLGNDLEIRPGGIVWLQAGKGAQHQEVPAVPGRELHGAQIYVNLSASNKMMAPKTMYLQPEEVPVWTNGVGDRVRVLVGKYGHLVSSIAPAEPYTILDAKIVTTLSVPVATGDHTVIYSLDAAVVVVVDGEVHSLASQSAIAIGGSQEVELKATTPPAHVLVMSGAALNEPMVADGPFIMTDAAGIRAAVQRYRAGDMGGLEPI